MRKLILRKTSFASLPRGLCEGMFDFGDNPFLVLLGGDLTVTAELCSLAENARAIAADSGIRHAEALGIEPELWVGDFDSSDDELKTKFAHVRQKQFPVEKDTSDGEMAMAEAIARGATGLILCGGLAGERTDHLFFNAAMALRFSKKHKIPVMLTSGLEQTFPIYGPVNLEWKTVADRLVSIVPLGDLKGLTLSGVYWPLQDRDVTFGSSLTLSNRTGEVFSINMEQGDALIVMQMRNHI